MKSRNNDKMGSNAVILWREHPMLRLLPAPKERRYIASSPTRHLLTAVKDKFYIEAPIPKKLLPFVSRKMIAAY